MSITTIGISSARQGLTYHSRKLGGKQIENKTFLSVGTDKLDYTTEQQTKGTLQKEHYKDDWQNTHRKLDRAEKSATFIMDNQGTHRNFNREVDAMKDFYSDGSHKPWGAQLKSPRNRTSFVTHDRSKHYDYGFDGPTYTPTTQRTMVGHAPNVQPEVFAGKSPQWISPASREMKTTHYRLGTDAEPFVSTSRLTHNSSNYNMSQSRPPAVSASSSGSPRAGEVLGMRCSVQLGTDSWDSSTTSGATYGAPSSIAQQTRRPRGQCAVSKRTI